MFLRALFALLMTDQQLAIYQHHTGRTTPPSANANRLRQLTEDTEARALSDRHRYQINRRT